MTPTDQIHSCGCHCHLPAFNKVQRDALLEQLLAHVPIKAAWKKSTDNMVAVAVDVYWQPIATCPTNVKVQLLGLGGVAVYGVYDGKSTFWTHWSPCPKKLKDAT